MSERAEQAKLRKAYDLPYRCECGGVMLYSVSFSRVFSCCKRCTPRVKVKLKDFIR